MASKLSMFSIILLLISACEKDINDPYGQLCDVFSQPPIIIIDSFELYYCEIITPNGDCYNDFFHLSPGITYLNEIFENVSFKVYNSSNNPIFTLENQEISYCGMDADGNHFGDGVYQYELILDDKVYTRLLGVYTSGFCLDDFNCSNSSGRFDKGDPLLYTNCN